MPFDVSDVTVCFFVSKQQYDSRSFHSYFIFTKTLILIIRKMSDYDKVRVGKLVLKGETSK